VKVLVTGASGFIGWPVVQSLLRKGHEVLGLCRKAPVETQTGDINWLHADLIDILDYRDAVQFFAPEVVVHLAWQGIPDYSFGNSRSNLELSLDLLSILICQKSCRKILVAGSCWELNQTKGKCLETEIGTPKDDFTWAKHSLRSWLELECSKNGVCLGWMRIFYAYGPRQRSDSLVPHILNNLIAGGVPHLNNPGNVNDFVYVNDVAEAFTLAVTRECQSGIYNLGSGVSTSVLEVCRTAERIITGSETLTRQFERETVCKESTVDFQADYRRSRKELGWSPWTNLDEGINQTWQWMKSH
jgi:nucleoside-diphosphate-sugar epimerase